MATILRPVAGRNAQNANIFEPTPTAPARDEARRRRRYKRTAATVDIFLSVLRVPHGQKGAITRLWHRSSDEDGTTATTARKSADLFGTSRSSADELTRESVKRSARIGVPLIEQRRQGYVEREGGAVVDSLYSFPALDILVDRALAERPKGDDAQRALCYAVLDEHWPEWRHRLDPPPPRPRPLTGIGQDVKACIGHYENGGKALHRIVSHDGAENVSAALVPVARQTCELAAEFSEAIPGIRAYLLGLLGITEPEPKNDTDAQGENLQTEPEGYVADTPLSGFPDTPPPSAGDPPCPLYGSDA